MGVALAAFAVALSPLLSTPRVSDDVINYSFRWLSPADFQRETLEEIRFWILSAGRLFVLSSYLKNLVFLAFETTLAYKVAMLAVNLACAAALAGYARLVLRSWVTPVAAVLALAVLVQLRDYHDPVVSFNGIFQLCLLLVLAALACHVQYARTGRAAWLAGCVGAFVANLFLYEMAAVTLPLLIVQELALSPRGRGRHRASLAVGVALAIYFAIGAWARHLGAPTYGTAGSLYSAGLDPRRVAETFVKQMVAVVPFTYFIFRPRNGAWDVLAPSDPVWWPAEGAFYAAAALFAAGTWVALRAAARADDAAPADPPARAALRTLLLVGAGLVLVPAGVIAMVSRYQNAFNLGNGYSPVYLQEMGAALIVGLVVRAVLRAMPASRTHAIGWFAAVAGIASAGNLVDNREVAAALTRAWSPQHAWAAMLRSPELQQACAGVGMLVATPRPWNEYRIVNHAGVRVADMAQLQAAASQPGAPGEFCVAGTVEVMGRPAAAFGRIATTASAAEGRWIAPIGVMVPLDPGEDLAAATVGAGCPGGGRSVAIGAARAFAEGRYGYVSLPAAGRMVALPPAALALPCGP
jgi:hypothetical protein